MEIQPEKQNLDSTFSSTVYHIDFYQRDYKWTEEPVRRLLDDVFYQFEETYAKHKDLDPGKEAVNDKYPWYYLNTYVTNTVAGRVFVVDAPFCTACCSELRQGFRAVWPCKLWLV